MGLTESEAVVLRTYKLAEADKIVVMLTPQAGLLRGVAKGARRLKSRFGACFELFTHISLSYHEREGRELVSIGGAEIIRSYFHLARDTEMIAALDYWSELLQEFVPPKQPDERLFRMVKACLDTLGHTILTPEGCTLYFEVWLLKLTGFLPDVRTCPSCRKTLNSPRLSTSNQLLCPECARDSGLTLTIQAHTLLRSAMNTGPRRWAEAAADIAPETRRELRQLTRHLITQALEHAPYSRRITSERGS
jgi:DNA repair protein RecO (recombination protein O)